MIRRTLQTIQKFQTPFKNKSLFQQNSYALRHIQSAWDEQTKVEVEKIQDEYQLVVNTDRVYKPTETIEFDRIGEVLLYSCDPNQHEKIYTKYPYPLYISLMPLSILNWTYNPLSLDWQWLNFGLIIGAQSWVPYMWFFRSLQYKVRKLSLLRGGKVLKIETNSLSGDRFVSYVETYQFHPLSQDQKTFDDRDEAEFLQEEGQLNYELAVQIDNLQEMGVTSQDIVMYFKKEGIVHNPELFEAALKGFNIDTSNFVINTANNIRAREGNYNH